MLDKLIGFLRSCENHTYQMENGCVFTLLPGEVNVLLTIGNKVQISDGSEYPLFDFAEDNHKDFRICMHCGKPFVKGMTDLMDIYVCEACFNPFMNSTYGENGWKKVDDDGIGGFYMICPIVEWEGTGIFYTEWS